MLGGGVIYLDWNATSPPADEVVGAMEAARRTAWANPSSVHGLGRAARSVVEDARAAVSALFGTDVRDLVFTSGGTEANNMALRAALPEGGAPSLIVTSNLEHPSIVKAASALESEGLARVHWLRVTGDGVIDVDDLADILRRDSVRVVALSLVNHETGVIAPIDRLVALVRTTGARLHLDCVQAACKLELRGIDFDSASVGAHKFRGPKGIGALVTRRGFRPVPLAHGGAQERGFRPGTVDPVAAAGFGAAARRGLERLAKFSAIARHRDDLEGHILASWSGAEVNGAVNNRLPHISNVAFVGLRGPELVAALDLEGVCVSSGSACSAGTAEPSGVVAAMSGVERAAASVRISLGDATTADDVQGAKAAFSRVLERARGLGGAR